MNKILLNSIITSAIIFSNMCFAPSDKLLALLKTYSNDITAAKKLILEADIRELDTSCLERISIDKRAELLKKIGLHKCTVNMAVIPDEDSICRCRALLERFNKPDTDTWESINTFMGKDILDFFSSSVPLTLHPYNILPVEFLACRVNSRREKENGTEAWLLIDFCMHIDDDRLIDPVLKPIINIHLESTREKLTKHLSNLFYEYAFDRHSQKLDELQSGFRIFKLFSDLLDPDGGQTWEDYSESLIRAKIKPTALSKEKVVAILSYCNTYMHPKMINLIQRISAEAPDPDFQ